MCRTDNLKVAGSNPDRGVTGFVNFGKLFHTCVLRLSQPSIPVG